MFTHGLGCMSGDDIEQWENGIKPMFASVAKNQIRPIPAFQFSTVELCAVIGLNGPLDQLHAARLRYVSRAIRIAPAALWKFLHNNDHENSWLPQLVVSFKWLRMHLRPGVIPDLSDAVSVLNFIAIDQHWLGHVRAALRSCLRFSSSTGRRANSGVSEFRTEFLGLLMFPLLTERHLSNVGNVTCAMIPFLPRKLWQFHARHKHQYRTVLKYYVFR